MAFQYGSFRYGMAFQYGATIFLLNVKKGPKHAYVIFEWSLIRSESIPSFFCSYGERRGYRKLCYESRTDIHVTQCHDGLVPVMMYSNFETFPTMWRKPIVVYLIGHRILFMFIRDIPSLKFKLNELLTTLFHEFCIPKFEPFRTRLVCLLVFFCQNYLSSNRIGN